MFLADLLSQTLQNVLVVMLVNHEALGKRFLMKNARTFKKDHKHVLGVQPEI